MFNTALILCEPWSTLLLFDWSTGVRVEIWHPELKPCDSNMQLLLSSLLLCLISIYESHTKSHNKNIYIYLPVYQSMHLSINLYLNLSIYWFDYLIYLSIFIYLSTHLYLSVCVLLISVVESTTVPNRMKGQARTRVLNDWWNWIAEILHSWGVKHALSIGILLSSQVFCLVLFHFLDRGYPPLRKTNLRTHRTKRHLSVKRLYHDYSEVQNVWLLSNVYIGQTVHFIIVILYALPDLISIIY